MTDLVKVKLTQSLGTATGNLSPNTIIARSPKQARQIIDAGFGVEYTGDAEPVAEKTEKQAAPEKAEKKPAKKVEKRG